MPAADAFTALGDERFVSLTTFRRSGEPVSTPVWVTSDGDALLVLTPEVSGKVKRLRHTPRVEVRPCSRRGAVPDDAPVAHGDATVQTDGSSRDGLMAQLRAKYGLEYRVVMGVERLVERRKNRGSGVRERVVLRITPV